MGMWYPYALEQYLSDYRIAGKFGRENVQQIYSFKCLAEKSLANE